MIPFVIISFVSAVLKNDENYWDCITEQPIRISAGFFLKVLRNSLHMHIPQNTLQICAHTHFFSQYWDLGSQAPGPGVISSFHNLIDSCQGTECLSKHGKPRLPKVLCTQVEYRFVFVVLEVWENWHIHQHNCSIFWCCICANKKYLVNIICIST